MGETFKVEIIDAIPPGRRGEPLQARRRAQRVGRRLRGAARPVDRLSQGRASSRTSPARTGAATSATRCSSASTAPRSRASEALEEHLQARSSRPRQRDHRKLGKELDLFMFDEVAPGDAVLLAARARSSTTAWSSTCAASTSARATKRSSRRRPSTRSSSARAATSANYNENMYRLWTEDLLEEQSRRTSKLKDDAAGRARSRSSR